MADSDKQDKQTEPKREEAKAPKQDVNHDDRPIMEQLVSTSEPQDTSLYVNAEGDVKRATRDEFNNSLSKQGYRHPGEDFVTKPEKLVTAEDVAPSGKKKS